MGVVCRGFQGRSVKDKIALLYVRAYLNTSSGSFFTAPRVERPQAASRDMTSQFTLPHGISACTL